MVDLLEDIADKYKLPVKGSPHVSLYQRSVDYDGDDADSDDSGACDVCDGYDTGE